jgi:hypothetical protein
MKNFNTLRLCRDATGEAKNGQKPTREAPSTEPPVLLSPSGPASLNVLASKNPSSSIPRRRSADVAASRAQLRHWNSSQAFVEANFEFFPDVLLAVAVLSILNSLEA